MENTSSSSSFTLDLFGPKDNSSSPSSPGLFGSVFGPPSTGFGKNSSHSGTMECTRKQDFGGQYGRGKNGTSENTTHRGKGESYDHTSKDKRTNTYQKETTEPCYFSSSIYYGGQEVYSPTSQPTVSQHIFKKDGGDEDPNGSNLNSACRGNWWQGSLYY
ncbi:uncharacterized protein LOC130763343 [Actinidia eriantha]|uniref:uncharacterized protein LOC130763343 n=1 Tax=Actinidia eriantha TaxID=165200 RepID=UPI002582BA06|nr:uncharacterized protein LOC130763343 [Actinidia eriantha]